MNNMMNQFNRDFSQLNAQMMGGMTQGLQALNQVAPHNVLGQMGQGSGTFSAKMGTQGLNERNIFGSGGA
jgi:hypothetical protein